MWGLRAEEVAQPDGPVPGSSQGGWPPKQVPRGGHVDSVHSSPGSLGRSHGCCQ